MPARRRPPVVRSHQWIVVAATVALLTGSVVASGTAAASPLAATRSTATATAAFSSTVTIGGLCLTNSGISTGGATMVQLTSCTGSANQRWAWGADGAVRNGRECLSIEGGSIASGAVVDLARCSGRSQQRFSLLPDGTLYSALSGTCVRTLSGNVAGSRVGLAPCDPSQVTQRWTVSGAPPAAFAFTATTPTSVPFADDTPGSLWLDKDGTFYFEQAHALYGATDSRRWTFYTGNNLSSVTVAPASSAVDRNNPKDSNADTTWRCNNSPTGLQATSDPRPGSGYAERNYCDLTGGVWVDPDTGWWYGLVHNEFTPNPFGDGLHYDSLDVAMSKDQGATWTITGHAITSPYSTARDDTSAFPQQTYYYGDGDPRISTDYASGYVYAFYATRTLNKAGGGAVWTEHVARAPISKKMAPGSWTKYDNGNWRSPGLSGAESDIIPADGDGSGYISAANAYDPTTAGSTAVQQANGTMASNSSLAVMNIAWSAYLGKYIATPQNNVAQATGTKTGVHFYETSDLATEKWTDMGLVSSVKDASWYRWFADSATLTGSTVLGKTFRYYCSIACSTFGSEYSDITITPSNPKDIASPFDLSHTYRIAAGRVLLGTSRGASGPAPSASTASRDAGTYKVASTGDGFYTITDMSSGTVLSVDDTTTAGRAWGAPVSLTALTGPATTGQEWSVQTIVEPRSSGASHPTGAIRLINRYSGLALSLSSTGAHVTTAPQRTWNNPGTSGSTSTVAAQTLQIQPNGRSSVITVTNPGPQTATYGTAITALQISASDSDRHSTLTYTASGLPDGLSIDPATGVITGTPSDSGTFSVTVFATDGTYSRGLTSFTWTVTRTDLALNRPTTASSIEDNIASLGPQYATDGNDSTRWSSNYSDPQWLEVDLGATHSITEVDLLWQTAYATAYQIQTSANGTDWTTIYSTSSSHGGQQRITGLDGSGRYIRVYCTARATGYGDSIYTFNVYGS